MPRAPAPCLLALLIALCGCVSTAYRSLEPAREMDRLAPLVEAYEAAEPRTVRVRTRGPEDVPLDVAVHEIGDGTADRVVVFVHGVLADHMTWRYVAGPLRGLGDLMLIDLPGSGRSEVRIPARMEGHGGAAYDTESLAFRVLEAIDARLDARAEPAREVAFVAHSYGTLITLRLLADAAIAPEHRDALDRVGRVVLVAPLDVALPFAPPVLERAATTPGAVYSLAIVTGLLKDRLAKGTIESAGGAERVPRESVDQMLRILGDPHRRRVAKAVLRNVVPNRKVSGQRVPDWERIEPIEETLGGLRRVEGLRVLLISGSRDQIVPHAMAWKLAAALPASELLVLRGAGHSPPVTRPRTLARAIEYFIERGTLDGLEEAEREEPVEVRVFRMREPEPGSG